MNTLLLLSAMAWSAPTCQDGQVHETLAAAVADLTCDVIQVGQGTFEASVVVERDLVLEGGGPDVTRLVCRDGPCFMAKTGAELEVSGMTLASDWAAVGARHAVVRLSNATLLPLSPGGGGLKLRDSDAWLRNVIIQVSDDRHPIAIDAVSGRGHDLSLDRVRFLGTRNEPFGMGAVYTINYGVDCTDCTFGGDRMAVPPL